MYFEFDDVRRFHQPYTDPFQRMAFWKPPQYNSPYLNWKRGMLAYTGSLFAIEPIRHFYQYFNLMSEFYEYPRNRVEANIFLKEVFRVEGFWSELSKKLAFGCVAAAGDTAIKLSAWQYIYGGTWSPQEYADYNAWKHLLCAIVAFTPTAPLTVPFETAKRAYYADKSWPLELRRGYTSPTQALFRIPFEEGPSYLFRGGFPLVANQWFFWVIYATTYSFHKDKYFFLWQYHDFGYDWIKFLNMSFSFAVASTCAYPAYFTREMVDIWPKERGGHCTWDNNYRKCFKWQIDNMDMLYYNYFSGYWRWVRTYGFLYLGALWLADNYGMMSNGNETFNGLEVINPIFVESS